MTTWTVAVRWLHWQPRIKRTFWQRVRLADTPLEMASGWGTLFDLVAVVIAAGFVIAAVVTTVALWIAAAVSVTVALVGRVVLRQPFLVEATTPDGGWAGWWIVGWRRARQVRSEVAAALASGLAPESIPVPDAIQN